MVSAIIAGNPPQLIFSGGGGKEAYVTYWEKAGRPPALSDGKGEFFLFQGFQVLYRPQI